MKTSKAQKELFFFFLIFNFHEREEKAHLVFDHLQVSDEPLLVCGSIYW